MNRGLETYLEIEKTKSFRPTTKKTRKKNKLRL